MKEKETYRTEMQILMEKIALFNKFPYYLIVKKKINFVTTPWKSE